MTDSETAVLRNAFSKALVKIDAQEKRITKQDNLIAEMGDENAELLDGMGAAGLQGRGGGSLRPEA